MYPLIGGRVIAHLRANVDALSLYLSSQNVEEIEKGYDFDPGFPHDFINMAGKAPQGPEDVHFLGSMGYFDYVQRRQPVKPHQGELSLPRRPIRGDT